MNRLQLNNPKLLFYLLLSSLFLTGFLHPTMFGMILSNSHFHGHSTYQPSASYYGWYNRLTFNFGLHTEHHDIAGIAWSRLPVMTRHGLRWDTEVARRFRIGHQERLQPGCRMQPTMRSPSRGPADRYCRRAWSSFSHEGDLAWAPGRSMASADPGLDQRRRIPPSHRSPSTSAVRLGNCAVGPDWLDPGRALQLFGRVVPSCSWRRSGGAVQPSLRPQ